MLARQDGSKAMTLFCLLAKHASHFAACSTNALIPRKVSHNDPTCHHSHWETAVVTTDHTLSCPAAGARSSAPQKTVSRKQLQFAPLQHEPSEAHAAASHADDGLLSPASRSSSHAERALLSPDSRSRSVGFDRATIQRMLHDAEVAKDGSRPPSASLLGKVILTI